MNDNISHKDRIQLKNEEERYETIKTLFTISFVLTDSLMIFDLVFNIIDKEIDEYLYFRFFITLFGLYGTLILIGGYYLIDYCDCDLSCQCSRICDFYFSSLGGCHLFIGGLFLIISYCVELCSIRFYFNNRDKITETTIIVMLYLLFISSTITIIILIILIINKKNEKRIKEKID